MGPIAIVFGVLLCALGATLYALAESKSVTALIPAFFGIALIVLGVLALNEKYRMHAMHGAALLGLVGTVFPAYRVVASLLNQRDWTLATTGQVAMAGLSAVFLALCVRSFIDARRRRKQDNV